MAQLENIEAIEKRLWNAADNLRANSNYASNEYFMPVMGLIFLRHAYSRYLAVKDGIEAGLPKRGGKARPLTKEDYSQKGAIYLRPEAQFDYLVSLPDSTRRDRAIQHAMESIEEDYDGLKGVLPKAEYADLDNEVLGQLLRTLNPEELKQASGDIFGRIYEYFLTQFADLKAHDGGEFFTPVSLVQMIANVIEPDHGKVLDPACGSGGMFVQSAHFVERMRGNPSEALTFYGMEKNPTTIRLAKMNLAVHGLEGDIQKAISYYEDPHELVGKADYVMANPPFNVDEVDADKIKNDPRLPFGLPGVNKAGKVSNGNREKDRVTIENTFAALLKFVQELDNEEHRAIREGLDPESLALYDLLLKPGLAKRDVDRIKKVAAELLAALKAEKLRIENWREKEATRDAVQVTIENFLWDDNTGLPAPAYSEEDVKSKSLDVYRHVHRVYPTIPSPFYNV